jgi:flagellar hook assembly protein FlgD
VSGRKVKTLVSEPHKPGYYTTIWDGTDDNGRKMSSGVYFIRFTAGECRLQNKILLVR